MNKIIATALLIATTSAVQAQSAAIPPAAVIESPALATTLTRTLPASTMITIASDKEISSKKIEVGEKFEFFVASDVSENGVVVIPRGTKAESTVTFKTGKAIGGKSGKFELSFDNLMLNGRRYALRGTHRQEGKGNTVAAVLGSIFVSGRSAVMLPGQTVTAFTNEPISY